MRQVLAFGSLIPCVLTFACSGSGSSGSNAGPPGDPTTAAAVMGDPHDGQYHLGPVDFGETQFHNACAPSGGYRQTLRDATGLGGEYLAGVSHTYAGSGSVCDACILVKTATGKSIVLRVVTYGDANSPGDIDVSPNAYTMLNTGEYPRTMTWEFAKCPDEGGIAYEYQGGSNVWWTSLWVRNPRVPLTKVEVKSTNHPNFIEMARGTDGTLTDASGFGEGAFTLRLTGLDGQTITHDFASFTPGELVQTTDQFQ